MSTKKRPSRRKVTKRKIPDDLKKAVADFYQMFSVLDTLREKYGDELVDEAIDSG